MKNRSPILNLLHLSMIHLHFLLGEEEEWGWSLFSGDLNQIPVSPVFQHVLFISYEEEKERECGWEGLLLL